MNIANCEAIPLLTQMGKDDEKEKFYQLFAEIIEDIAMERAIAEGETTELVSRETIFNIL